MPSQTFPVMESIQNWIHLMTRIWFKQKCSKIYSFWVAQHVPKSKNLSGHQFYSCFLPKRWGKCIEIPKKLMARVCTLLPHLGPHLPYGYQGKNAIFWSRSFLTPLIAWKTQTNIGKQLCISQCPTRGPRSTKIELSDQIRSSQKKVKKSIFQAVSMVGYGHLQT